MQTANLRPRHSKKAKRQGAVLLLVLFFLPVLFIFIAFSIDLANVQKTRTELRVANDLAAKAAAHELMVSGNQSNAINVGKQVAEANQVAGNGLTLDDTDFVFGTGVLQGDGTYTFNPGGTTPNGVRVTGRRTTGSADGAIGSLFGAYSVDQSFEASLASAAVFHQVDICLVLDRSSSMKRDLSEAGGLGTDDPRWCKVPNGSSKWSDLSNAVEAFVEELETHPGQENLAVVTFGGNVADDCSGTSDNSTVTLDQPLTTNLADAENVVLDRMNTIWNGMTDVEAGMQAGINELLNSRAGAKRVMILFTDGRYTEANPIPMATTAANNDIIVHTITFGGSITDPFVVDMATIAANGNGVHIHAPTKQALQDAFRDLVRTITVMIE